MGPGPIPAGLKAAEEAERGQGYLEAAEVYERILGHVTDPLVRAQILCRLGNAHYQAVDPARAQRYFEQGIPLLEAEGRHREAGRYRMLLGRCYWERSRPDAAREEYEHARVTLEAEGPSEDLANAYVRLAGLHMFECEYEECKAMAQRAIEVAHTAHADAARIWAAGFLGGGLMALGQPEEGLALIDASHRDAMAQGLHWIARNALHNGIVMRCTNLRAKDALGRIGLYEELRIGGRPTPLEPFAVGSIWFFLGYPDKARVLHEQAAVLAREGESSTAEGWIRQALADNISALGRSQEAPAMMRRPEEKRELQDDVRYIQSFIRIAPDAGEVDQAVAQAERTFVGERRGALQDARPVLDAGVEAWLRGGRVARRAARLGRPPPFRARGWLALPSVLRSSSSRVGCAWPLMGDRATRRRPRRRRRANRPPRG